jgi:hypothetical protein
MLEKDVVALFEKICNQDKKFEFIHKENSPNPADPHMDIEFIYDGMYIRAEAKHVNEDPRRQSQSALSLFGSILKGRHLSIADPNKSKNKEVVYALVLYDENSNKYKANYQKIDQKDWKKFGKEFEVYYIFLISNTEIKVVEWDKFISVGV